MSGARSPSPTGTVTDDFRRKVSVAELDYLPLKTTLRDGRRVEVTAFEDSGPEVVAARVIINEDIKQGRTWLLEDEFETDEVRDMPMVRSWTTLSMQAFRKFFLSGSTFAVRAVEEGFTTSGEVGKSGELLGAFFIKPAYPGSKCSHVCTAGFLSNPHYRRKGIGRLMGSCFLKFAHDLGFMSAYLDVIFESNTASVRLWESLGFQKCKEIPNAARINGVGHLDTILGYYIDLENDVPPDFDPLLVSSRRDSIALY